MNSDWFNGINILQSGWQHGEKVGYCYPSGLEKTLCKWEVYVPLVTKGLKNNDMCGACSMCKGEERGTDILSVGKPDGMIDADHLEN
jgi:hypothetical protein